MVGVMKKKPKIKGGQKEAKAPKSGGALPGTKKKRNTTVPPIRGY